MMTMGKTKKKAKARKARSRISAARLAEMIEEATVDAHDESEQVMGWFTMFESCLELPFETEVLGVRVTVEAIEQRDDNRIVAVCKRGKENQAIELTELPEPREKPAGAEWIEAYRQWRGGQ
jgi:calcium binding protein